MADTPSYIPEGHHTVTPYMIIKNASEAIEFYKKGFDAKETYRQSDPDGRIRHAEIVIGNSPLMITDEWQDYLSPATRGGTPVHLYLYVENADELFNRAVSAGASVIYPMEDKPYGDRMGGVVDPFGHIWYLATHIGAAEGHE
jgi:PhnB protein